MTRAEKVELLKVAVNKLDEAVSILQLAGEEVLSRQVAEVGDLIDVLTATEAA